MKLTKYQFQALVNANNNRGKKFPIIGTLLKSWKTYIIISLVICCYSWWAWGLGQTELSIASLGFLLGILVRDIIWLRLQSRMWPLNNAITDWNEVEKLINENQT